MQFSELKNSAIVMLGKPRAFVDEEFARQLNTHNISVVKSLDEGAIAVVEGRMLNPLEQDRLEQIYLNKTLPILSIDTLERYLSEHIVAKKLLMSLKLSRDTKRLFAFLTNPLIDDSLFLSLLLMYDFGEDGFFGSNDNRDVSAALIKRFYSNIGRDHNAMYSNYGVLQLIQSSTHSELIETLSSLKLIKEALLNSQNDKAMESIIHALAIHPLLSTEKQAYFHTFKREDINSLLAMREDISLELQRELAKSESYEVRELLSKNPSLHVDLLEELLDSFEAEIISSIKLDDTLFKRFLALDTKALCANATLDEGMQLHLVDRGEHLEILAANSALKPSVIKALLAHNDEAINSALSAHENSPLSTLELLFKERKYHTYLASNPSLSPAMIESLAKSDDIEVLKNICRNESTPLELLNYFMLDFRLEHIVRENRVIHENFRR